VIRLQRAGSGRRITVKKHRGVGQHEGSHGLEIREDGLEVFPRLDAEPYRTDLGSDQFVTGIPAFDQLLGGGIERGTVTIITGPSGVGKTTLATNFLAAAAEDERPATMYQFEEAVDKLTHRAESFGIPITELQDEGSLRIEAIEPLTLSAEEFAQRISEQAAEHGTELVVIDGTEGYQLSLHGEPNGLVNSLHALTRYLTSTDITVVLIDQSEGSGGMIQPTSRNFSYLADNVVVLNYIERGGAKERVASVLKKRVGSHEETVRPYTIEDDGIRMRDPVPEIEGFLSGQPKYGDGPDGRNS
jgi:circadian clock protein KaiC